MQTLNYRYIQYDGREERNEFCKDYILERGFAEQGFLQSCSQFLYVCVGKVKPSK